MRIVKWVFGGLAAVVVVLGLTWVMVPKDRIINFALDRVEAQTGRYISVGGDAELKFSRIWLWLPIRLVLRTPIGPIAGQ